MLGVFKEQKEDQQGSKKHSEKSGGKKESTLVLLCFWVKNYGEGLGDNSGLVKGG